jgi:hypothetical protein
MEPATTPVEITKSRKTVVLSMVGVVFALCLVAAFVPSAKDSVVVFVKLLLEFITKLI